MSAGKQLLKDVASLYPKFHISSSGLSGTFDVSESCQVTADEAIEPEDWKVFDPITGNFSKISDIQGVNKLVIAEFISTWKEFRNEDPKDNLKDAGFDLGEEKITEKVESIKGPEKFECNSSGEVEEVVDIDEKMRILEALENGEIKAPIKDNNKVRTNVTTSPQTYKKPVSKMPMVIPSNVSSKQISELTPEDIINYICPKANASEAMIFLKLCQARRINPFLKEAYLIKYNQADPAQMVVARDYFARKAEEHPMYDGYESGIFILREAGVVEKREGMFLLPEEKLVGGWCKVYRKDRSRPILSEVALHEYQQRKSDGTLNKFWSDKIGKPATMIEKVAFAQGHRKAFPGDFSGMYDRAELLAGVENLEGLDDYIIEAECTEA